MNTSTPKNMDLPEENSFSMLREECEHCGAIWLNGVHHWNTGCTGVTSEHDLAGLICNTEYGNKEKCINPKLGATGGDTWEKRMNFIGNWDPNEEEGQNTN